MSASMPANLATYTQTRVHKGHSCHRGFEAHAAAIKASLFHCDLAVMCVHGTVTHCLIITVDSTDSTEYDFLVPGRKTSPKIQ